MKEQILNELFKLLQSANGAANGAGDLLRQKVPELCHQIVAWEIGFHLLFFIFFVLTMAFGVWVMKKFWKDQKERWECNCDCSPSWMLGALVAGASVPFAMINAVDLMYALISPDLVVLDYLRGIR
jgi:hypothetical protein